MNELQNYRTTELQNYRTTELQNYRTTELQNYRTTELQNYRTTELQNYRTTELQTLDLGLSLFSKKNRSCLRGIFLKNFRSGALALIIMHVISAKVVAFAEIFGLLFYFFRGVEAPIKIEGDSNLIYLQDRHSEMRSMSEEAFYV